MNIENTLLEIVNEVLKKHPHVFLVEVNKSNENYEIVLDGDELLGIYDISEISREVNHIADEKMPETQYSLEIGTPGADSDIKLLRQYPKHIGRKFELRLLDGSEIIGKLDAIDGDTLSFEYNINENTKKKTVLELVQTEFKNIKKANIILSFK
jgi:ribosome maturation factor RimP